MANVGDAGTAPVARLGGRGPCRAVCSVHRARRRGVLRGVSRMSEPDALPNELRSGFRNLSRSFRTIDASRSFDRCYVGSEPCTSRAIQGHAIAKSVLELIADENRQIVGSPDDPPRDPIAWSHQPFLAERSINKFSLGRWSCAAHDSLFSPIDKKNADLQNTRNLFLSIYRVTLRVYHYLLRVVGRLVFTALDPATRPEGLPRRAQEDMAQLARTGTPTVIRTMTLLQRMSGSLEEGRYDEIEFRVAKWNTKPRLAASGMVWLDGPVDSEYATGSPSQIPRGEYYCRRLTGRC